VDSKTVAGGPTPPKLTSKDLLHQFWADAYGKMQSAATGDLGVERIQQFL
jgi:hypothetical protein